MNRFLNVSSLGSSSMLRVSEDGEIKLHIAENEHTVADDSVVYLGGLAFVPCYVSGNSGGMLFFRLKDAHIPDVMDFFSYWDKGKLQELKNEKVKSFLDYISFCLDFIRSEVDVEKYKPTYSTEFVDLRDCGGGTYVSVEVFLTFGNSWDEDYEKTYDLTESLTGKLFERELQGGRKWVGEVMVVFRPAKCDKEGYLPF